MRPRATTAPALVLGAVVSVQFGAALAATLIPRIGVTGSVSLRLIFAALVLLSVTRPSLRGHPLSHWRTVIGFGVVLGAMNLTFYAALAHLPIGVAVTVEFVGPLTLAAVQGQRLWEWAAVAAAAGGVALVSGAMATPWAELDRVGLLLAAGAGALWAAYIVLSQRTGRQFPKLEGLALAMGIATLCVLPFGLPSVARWTPDVLGVGLAIALLSSVLPYSLELVALRHLGQHVFGILLSLEPAVAALAGFVVLDQLLDLTQVLGIVAVVAASVIVLGTGRRPELPDPAESASA